ncbi:unnamed protein product [Closterium sp. Naga37s-1]|nr:unnamed protein product [Closterium sp. Naga37s-1]
MLSSPILSTQSTPLTEPLSTHQACVERVMTQEQAVLHTRFRESHVIASPFPFHQAYVEGYLQAMLDTLYRQPYVTVKIANDTVSRLLRRLTGRSQEPTRSFSNTSLTNEMVPSASSSSRSHSLPPPIPPLQVVLKNLPPNTSLTNEMVTCVTDFLVTEGLLEPERGGGRDGGRGGRGRMGMPAAAGAGICGAAGGAGEVSAFRSLRRIHGEQMVSRVWDEVGPHNARVAVRALLEQLAVTLLIRTLRHQTARWLHVKPPPGTQADEGAATAAATGDGRGEEGQEEGRAASLEADLSAQLSVADLLSCLSRIEERSEQIKAEIIQEVEGRHEELRQLMWHACQAGDDVAVLLAEVDALAASVSPAEATESGPSGREGGGNHEFGSGQASATGSGAALGFVEEVVRATNEVRALNQAANEKAEIRKAVEEIVQLQRKQAEMQVLLGRGRLLEAATLARSFKDSFVEGDVGGPRDVRDGEAEGKGREEEQREEPVVVTLLRQQVDGSCKQLQHSLEQQLWQMLVIDPSSHSIRIVTSAALTPAITSADSTASAPVVLLSDVLSALEVLTSPVLPPPSAPAAPAPAAAAPPPSTAAAASSLGSLPVAAGPLWSRIAASIHSAIVLPLLSSPSTSLIASPPADASPASPRDAASPPAVVLIHVQSETSAPASATHEPSAGAPSDFSAAAGAAAGAAAAAVTPFHLYPLLLDLIRFLSRHLTSSSGGGGSGSSIRLQRLAAALWPRMADSIIERCLALAVPQETRELARFQEVVEVTRAFEAALRAEGFLAPLPKASAALKGVKLQAGGTVKRAAAPVGDRLMAYAADVDMHFAEKKRVAALAAVRHLLLKGDFSVSRLVVTPVSPDVSNPALQPAVFGQQLLQLVVGEPGTAAAEATSDMDNSVFFWEPCHVSEPVCKIIEIVHNTMEEASQSTDRTAMELYRAARDIFTLYRALPSSAPVDVAQLAMIAVNDRLLLSHVCLSLALQYRARLPAGVRHVATFADVSPFLRQLAEEQMQRVLERHHGYLMEALDGAQGFRNTDEEEVYRSAPRALKQVVHHLAHLSSVWRPVSPPSRYLRSMSRLVSAVLSRCCAHVLGLPDISVDETEQLRKLFAGMLTRLPPLFHVDLSGAIGSAHGATSASVAAAADLDADVSDAVADTATLESLVPVFA